MERKRLDPTIMANANSMASPIQTQERPDMSTIALTAEMHREVGTRKVKEYIRGPRLLEKKQTTICISSSNAMMQIAFIHLPGKLTKK